MWHRYKVQTKKLSYVLINEKGGVGILATGPLNATQTKEAIQKIRQLAPNKPFGIGATLLMPGAADNAKVALDEHVPLINVSLGKPDWIANAADAYGGELFYIIIIELCYSSFITSYNVFQSNFTSMLQSTSPK